ncbi:hypothetical protein BJ912DRAFT_1065567 [Pholiota molesta]|nr:hypothetical protein BJ912DRAFT_1065567 [Pholiota molesta]
MGARRRIRCRGRRCWALVDDNTRSGPHQPPPPVASAFSNAHGRATRFARPAKTTLAEPSIDDHGAPPLAHSRDDSLPHQLRACGGASPPVLRGHARGVHDGRQRARYGARSRVRAKAGHECAAYASHPRTSAPTDSHSARRIARRIGLPTEPPTAPTAAQEEPEEGWRRDGGWLRQRMIHDNDGGGGGQRRQRTTYDDADT